MSTIPIGHLLDERFRIKRHLGSGGFASVYLAEDVTLNRDVAVKFAQFSQWDALELKRFRREAQILSQLRHKNIVHVYASGIWQGQTPYLVMELVQGSSLRTLIDANMVPPPDVLIRIFAKCADALEHAASFGVIHRDLTSSNICINDADGEVKLIDFGLSRTSLAGEAPVERLTQTGLAVGSPQYMSPEAVQGATADVRSDIYSLGCVLYECLTGHVPFEFPVVAEIMMAQATTMPPTPKLHPQNNNETGARLANVALMCLQKQAEERFQSYDEFRLALMTARQNDAPPLGWNEVWIGSEYQPKSRSGPNRAWLILPCFVACVFILLGLLLLSPAAVSIVLEHIQPSSLAVTYGLRVAEVYDSCGLRQNQISLLDKMIDSCSGRRDWAEASLLEAQESIMLAQRGDGIQSRIHLLESFRYSNRDPEWFLAPKLVNIWVKALRQIDAVSPLGGTLPLGASKAALLREIYFRLNNSGNNRAVDVSQFAIDLLDMDSLSLSPCERIPIVVAATSALLRSTHDDTLDKLVSRETAHIERYLNAPIRDKACTNCIVSFIVHATRPYRQWNSTERRLSVLDKGLALASADSKDRAELLMESSVSRASLKDRIRAASDCVACVRVMAALKDSKYMASVLTHLMDYGVAGALNAHQMSEIQPLIDLRMEDTSRANADVWCSLKIAQSRFLEMSGKKQLGLAAARQAYKESEHCTDQNVRLFAAIRLAENESSLDPINSRAHFTEALALVPKENYILRSQVQARIDFVDKSQLPLFRH